MALFGFINVNKPSGITSRRVVDRVQRLVKPAKVGHAGTLDPLASGVLVVGIGQATRLVEYIHQLPKSYRATFLLGRTSSTEDVEGEVAMIEGATPPSRDDIERAAARLVGQIEQRPPAFSALKVAGRRAYALARGGETVDLAPRTIHVHRLQVTRYDYPELQLEIECGSGTYVRSLGRDLAQAAGSGAVMSALVRTAIGPFALEEAVDIDGLDRDSIGRLLMSPLRAVEGLFAECHISDDDVRRLANGLPVRLASPPQTKCVAVDGQGRLVAILAPDAVGTFRAEKYFPDT